MAMLGEFERRGFVRLRGIFTVADAQHMRERIWKLLRDEYGVEQAEPRSWSVRQPTGFQSLTRSGAFAAFASPRLVEALDELLGPDGWRAPKHWGSPLVTFPHRETRWDVPSRQWHLDFPARGRGRPLFAVRILAFLDGVEPRAGGTLVVEGSHQLVERFVGRGARAHSRDTRRAFMQMHPWFRDLCSESSDDRIQRFMHEGATVDGVALRVVELVGEAGDAFLMHPWQLHAPAPNCGTSPRLMLAHTVVRDRHHHREESA
jgi:ectoine hydroxylase-related dioxygenase (phytanoyl-CoA dioxygenase family)